MTNDIRTTHTTMEVDRPMEAEDYTDLGDEMRLALAKFRSDESEHDRLKAATSQAKKHMEASQAGVNIISDRFSRGVKTAEVPVQIRYDYTAREVITVDVETGEELERRELADEETQLALKLLDSETCGNCRHFAHGGVPENLDVEADGHCENSDGPEEGWMFEDDSCDEWECMECSGCAAHEND